MRRSAVRGTYRFLGVPWLPCALALYALGAGAEVSHDDVFWESVAECTDAVEVQMYLDEFPEGRHVEEARACLRSLGISSVGELLEECEAHFEANRLTTGEGGTAVACYEEVLSQEPGNPHALEGLQRVREKYAGWARAALGRGEVAKARGYMKKIEGLDPETRETTELRAAIEEWERERALTEAKEQAERERTEAEAKAERERLARERAEAEERERLARKWPLRKVFRDCAECPELEVYRDTDGRPIGVSRDITYLDWEACLAADLCSTEDLGSTSFMLYLSGVVIWRRGIDAGEFIPENIEEARAHLAEGLLRPVGFDDGGEQKYIRWLSYRTGYMYEIYNLYNHGFAERLRVYRTLE